MEKQGWAELVEACRQGEPDAFEALYNATIGRTMGLALSMIKQEQDARDVLQDSYLYAFRSLGSLRKPEQFPAWIRQIVADRCKNYLTRTRPKLFAADSLTGEMGEDKELEDEDGALRPDESMDNEETRRIVREMVDALPEEQRLCVLLYYFQEMSVAGIASLLSVSENTVKSRLRYARAKLRAEAEDIESRGTVLHGAALFPLLRVAFQAGVEESVASAGAPLLQGVLGSLGAGGAVAVAGAATGTAAGAAGGVAAFLGTVAGKVVALALVAALTVGGYVALHPTKEAAPEIELARSEPEAAPEPAPIQEEPPVRELSGEYVFDQRFGDQQGGAPLEEYHLRVALAGDLEVTGYDLERGSVHLLMRRGERFSLEVQEVGNGQFVYHIIDRVYVDLERGDDIIFYEAIETGVVRLDFAFEGEENWVDLSLYLCIAEEDGSLPGECWPHIYYDFLSGFRFREESELSASLYLHDNIDPEFAAVAPELRTIMAGLAYGDNTGVPWLYLAESYGTYLEALVYQYRIEEGALVFEGYTEWFPEPSMMFSDFRDGPQEMQQLLIWLEEWYDLPYEWSF